MRSRNIIILRGSQLYSACECDKINLHAMLSVKSSNIKYLEKFQWPLAKFSMISPECNAMYHERRFGFTYDDMTATQIPTASRSSECCDTETRVFATIAPLAATAGTPIPGKVESPQQKSWGIGVACPGKVPSPAFMAGP